MQTVVYIKDIQPSQRLIIRSEIQIEFLRSTEVMQQT